jgi:predicted small secreted protein
MTRKDFLIGAIVSLAFGFMITIALRVDRQSKRAQVEWRQWADTADCADLRARVRDMEP